MQQRASTVQTLFDLPLAFVVYCTYSLPVYFLANLQPVDLDAGYSLLIFVALMVLYCLAWRHVAIASALALPTRAQALTVTGTLACSPIRCNSSDSCVQACCCC